MTEKRSERRGLGRGLSALMADVMPATGERPRRPDLMVPIERIEPNPDQPRRDFAPDALRELADSIREKGIIQPLIVRPVPEKHDTYQIVAGERRWRAAQLARLHEVPVVIRDVSDSELLELAIIENIQRADLNAIEEAMGYRQLMDRFGHTQDKMAAALAKSRSHIANLLRLLSLPDQVQVWVREGKLSAGHARALVSMPEPVAAARRIIDEGLSVREAERLAASGRPPSRRGRAKPPGAKDQDTRVLEQDLSANLGMKVVIDHRSDGHGQVTISYPSLDKLDELCRLLSQLR